MLTCDPKDTAYSACNSAFAKTVPLLPEKRKLDREAIMHALEQSGTFARIEQAINDIETSKKAHKKEALAMANLRPAVSEVVNAPRLFALDSKEALDALSVKHIESIDQSAGSFWVYTEFGPLSRHLPRARVSCTLVADADKYRVDNALSGPVTFNVVARVDHCDLDAPLPAVFTAAKKDSPLVAKLTSFNPGGTSSFSISNTSNSYVTVASFSIYYFSEIVTSNESFRVPPHGVADKLFPSIFRASSYHVSNVTDQDLEQNTFAFGVAVEYQTEGVASKTMLSVEQLPLKVALADTY